MGVEIPSAYDIAITELPPMTVGIPTDYSVTVARMPQINIRTEPVALTVRLAEIPSVRGHIPANYRAGLSVFGVEVLAVRLCGETQVITEPFVPNPCERCGQAKPLREHAQAAAMLSIREPTDGG